MKSIDAFTNNVNIFITIPWFHPAFKAGGPIQSIANLVKELDGTAFQFKIFCGNKDLDGVLLKNIEFDKWVNYSPNTLVWYASSNNILPILKKEIKNCKPDILFINGIYSWLFNFKPLFFCGSVKKIISVRGMLHAGALSQKAFKKRVYLSLWKLLGLHKKAIFHATDENEKKYIQQVFTKKARVVVAPNFPRIFPFLPVLEKKAGHLKLVSIALISPMKNILLVLEALSGIPPLSIQGDDPERVPRIDYNIYGPVKDNHYWQQCLAVIKKIPANISVVYHGDIPPTEIDYALSLNHVFILPSKSENFGHAIFEALSSGRPVITSEHVPWTELQRTKAGMNVSIDNSREIKKAIQSFVAMGTAELNEWSKKARQYTMSKVDLDKIKEQYKTVFEIDT